MTTPVAMGGVSNAVAVSGGNSSSFIRAADGSVRALGFLGVGGLGTGQTLRHTQAVTAPF